MKKGLTILYKYENLEKLNQIILDLKMQSLKEYQLIVFNYDKTETIKTDIDIAFNSSLSTILESIKYDKIYFIDSKTKILVDTLRIMSNSLYDTDVVMGNALLNQDNKNYYFNRSPFLYDNKIYDYSTFLKMGYLNFEFLSLYNKVFTFDLFLEILKNEKEIDNLSPFKLNWLLIKYSKKIKNIKNAFFVYKNLNLTFNQKEIESFYLKEVTSNHSDDSIVTYWKHLFNIEEDSTEDSEDAKEIVLYYNKEKNALDYNFENFENTKRAIISKNTEYVSFDIFDTLIKRCVLLPTDIFVFLDQMYNELSNNRNYIYFSKMRIKAENICRSEIISPCEEITFDDIYKKIGQIYNIDFELLIKLMNYEIELEKQFCIKREAGYELFDLAKYSGKKVIAISDMYLDYKVIENILNKNGYTFDHIFLSSVTKKLKYTGNAFNYALKKLNIEPSKMVHIGDNYNSDVNVPNNIGINAFWLQSVYSALDNSTWYKEYLANDFNKNYTLNDGMNFIGNKSLIAIIINRIYDYPFYNEHNNSMYNSSPILIGQIPVAMACCSIANTIKDHVNKFNYQKIHFAARDGYLLMGAYDTLYPEDAKKTNYLYMSRKLLMPLSIKTSEDFWSLKYSNQDILLTPKRIFELFQYHIKTDEKKYINLCKKNNFDYDKYFVNDEEIDRFIREILIPNFDDKKSNDFINMNKEYYGNIITKNNVLVDIGYSGRGELILSNILGYPLNSIYVHAKNDIPYNRANKEHFTIDTIDKYLPKISGSIREYIFSKPDSTCIKYDFKEGKYIFEKLNFNQLELDVINLIQTSCKQILEDFYNNFKNLKLIFKNFELNELLENFYYSPMIKDAELFKVFKFEDDLNFSDQKYYNLFDLWIGYINETSGNKYYSPTISSDDKPVNVANRNLIKRIIIKIVKPVYTKVSNRAFKIVKDSTYEHYKNLDNHLMRIDENNKNIEKLLNEINRKIK